MKRRVILQYTLFGVLFGLMFPLIATLWGIYVHGLPYNLESARQVQLGDLLYTIIDTAPLFLGVFAWYGGVRHAQALHLNRELEQGILERSQMVVQLEGLRSNLEQVVEKQVVQLKASARVARETATIHDLHELLNQTTALISDQFGFYHTGIFLVDENNQFAILQATNSPGGKRMLERGHQLKVGQEGIVGFVAAHNTHRIALDVGDDVEFFNNPDLPQTRSEIALPLSVRERVIGVLDVQSTQAAAFADSDVEILRQLADQVALAIDNARLFNQTQSSLEQMETLYNQQLHGAWQRRLASRPIAFRYDPLGVKSSSCVDLAGLQDDSHLLNAPISIRGQLLGRLIFRRDAELPAWTDAERHLLSESAAQIALALENARLVEGAQRRSSQLQFLHELASTTIAHNNLDGLVEDVSERIRVRFNVQRCGVVMFDLARGSATFAADACQASAAGVSAVGARVPMDTYELAREMVNSQRPLVISDAQHNPRSAVMHEFMRQRGTNTWVVAPLVSRGGVLGLIGLEDPDSQRGFEADELLFLEQVSNQVASALDVMTMVDRTRLQARYEHQQAEIVSKMRRTTDMEMILKTAIQELAETLKATRGSIQLGGNHGD